ncbi:diguanylate cyclase domain-containing protein [Aeromonas bestiarum]|uniref:diguanylate cyclase domain-containing protein n=1 Tax=Aeromonas bestiarum TaxID=105751 RepID=UPI000506B9C0|nr:diguanylate cyclase [Aeromonas bestiarum]KFN21211.1 diguanylate cyclase [Aeromonas bestiarum]
MTGVNSSLHRLLWYLPMLGMAICYSVTSLPLRAADQIVVQLPWQHQFQFAGYYAAQFKGFYRDAGLNVALRAATPQTNVVNEVVSGNAQFGISGSDLLLARAAGRPVVVLAAMLQHSPLVLLSLERPDILHPSDLAGKRLMLEPGSRELQVYLGRHAQPQSWTRLPYEQGLQALLTGQVDAISAYSTTEPFYLAQLGIPYRVFSPRDIDFDFYGDNLFTSEHELAGRPERVYAFQQASLKGWRYAMENPEEMISWIMENYPSGYGREQLEFEARETRELMQPDLIEPGYMQPERWQQIARTYLEAGLLSSLPDLERFLYNPDRERMRQQRQLFDKSVAVAMLITFTLLTLLGIFCHLYLRLRQEARDRLRLTRELAQSEQHYRFVAENSADVIWTMDTATLRFRYVSPAILPLSGYEAIDILSLPLKQLIPETSRKQLRDELSDSLAAWQRGDHEQTRCVIRTQLRHREGHLVATETITTLHGNEKGQPDAILGVTRDITERAASEEMMHRLAFYDPLTNLPNRRLLQLRLKEAMADEGRELALMFIDLDHFKPINDTFGHETGDVLLNMVAERMRHCVREQDLVARLGGDEFVILLPDISDEALAVADHLHQSLRHPFRVDEEQELRISSSIGVALYPEHGTDPKTLMHHADQAMYQAKGRGRGRVCLFTAGLDPELGSLLWQNSHECGHPRIDAEHRQLFVLTNRLLERMKDNSEHPALYLESLEGLFEMARHHFAFEEQMLAELEYAELASHQQDHQRLLHRASQLMTAARAGELGNDELLNFIIQELVVGHMSQADRRYFPLMKGR